MAYIAFKVPQIKTFFKITWKNVTAENCTKETIIHSFTSAYLIVK